MPEYYDYEDAILVRQEADGIWDIYEDTGYDDLDLEGMLEEWEADDAEDNN